MSLAPKAADRRWTEEERRIRVDALLLWWPYAEGSLRATLESLIDEAQSDVWNQENEAQMLACAAATWPARLAVRLYASAHPEALWERLVPRCLPTTQVLLKRLAEQEGTVSYPEILRSPQADFALHESERLELELLLPQICALLWQDCQNEMGAELERAKQVREEKRALFADPAAMKEGLSVFDHLMVYGDGEGEGE